MNDPTTARPNETRRVLAVDRDGVLNRDLPTGVLSADELVWLPGSLQALADISRAGWLVAVVTNQANVGRGLLSRQTLDGFHARLVARVRALGGDIHGVFVCPHAPEEGCACRKPKPGLLEQLASDLHVTPAQCLMVGDDLRDAHAAAAFGCDAARVLTGKGKAPSWAEHPAPRYDDLAAVVQSLLRGPLGKAP